MDNVNLAQKLKVIKEYLDKSREPVLLEIIKEKFSIEKLSQIDLLTFGIETIEFYTNFYDREKRITEKRIDKRFLISKNALFELLNSLIEILSLKYKGIIEIDEKEFNKYLLRSHFFEDINLRESTLNITQILKRFCDDNKKYIFFNYNNNFYIINLNYTDKITPFIASCIREYKKLDLSNLLAVLRFEYGINLEGDKNFDIKKFLITEDRFILNSSSEVSLSDDIDYLKNFLTKNKYTFDEITENYSLFNFFNDGIIAFHFVGEEFPLKEAKEYISARPIIYLGFTDKISNFLNIGSTFSSFYESEFWKYLSLVLDENVDVKNWLKRNTMVSVYVEKNLYKIRDVYFELVKQLSPIFNVNNNPGNLFAYTLEQKVQEFIEKQEKEKKGY